MKNSYLTVTRGQPAVGPTGANKSTAGEEVTVVCVDITCDLMDEDETGHVWAFLGDACDQVESTISQIAPNTATAPIRRVGRELFVEPLTWPYICGRYWDRTSDLLGVNEALSR